MAPSPANDSALLEILSAYPSPPGAEVSVAPNLVDRASAHGVPALVRWALMAAEVPVSAELLDALRLQALKVSGVVLKTRAVLLRTLDALAAAGVKAVPLKGYWLGARLYPDPLWRLSTDVDVLVEGGASLMRAERALVAAGFSRSPAFVEARERQEHHHLTFECDAGTLELHFLLTTAFGLRLQPAPFLERASPSTFEGRTVWTLSPEDELLYLSLHATQSLLLRLGWLVDVKLLSRQPCDWQRLVQLARGLDITVPAWVSLSTAARHLGAPIPPEVLDALSPGKVRGAFFSGLFTPERLEATSLRAQPWLGNLALALSAADLPHAGSYLSWMAVRSGQRRLAQRCANLFPRHWLG
jgi:hypothetical protein